jgi:hypothetical protein
VPANSDRYEPLPSFLEIPGFLIKKLGPTGRRILAVFGALLALGAVAFLMFGMPAIERGKDDRAAAEARATAEARRERIAKLQAEVRPIAGEGAKAAGLAGPAAVGARRTLFHDLTDAVEADATKRVQSGEFSQPIIGARCERYPPAPYRSRAADPTGDLQIDRARFSCLAITARFVASSTSEGGRIGYPYRAVVDFPTGHFTYCKVSGVPGEGSLARRVDVRVPPQCGGAG